MPNKMHLIARAFVLVAAYVATGFNEFSDQSNDNVASAFVIRGDDSVPGKWPWQVALFIDDKLHCGGSILNRTFILTAAHCLDSAGVPGFRMKVIAGVYNISEEDQHSQTRDVVQTFTHPKYQRHFDPRYQQHLRANDIGLVELEWPLEYGDRIQPVPLPPKGEDLKLGSIVTVTGWGLKKPVKGSDILLEGQVEVIAAHLCKSPYAASQICTAYTYQSACDGDTGGPLVFKRPDNLWYLYGITSGSIYDDFGIKACVFPTIFTKTSAYIDWIKYNQS